MIPKRARWSLDPIDLCEPGFIFQVELERIGCLDMDRGKSGLASALIKPRAIRFQWGDLLFCAFAKFALRKMDFFSVATACRFIFFILKTALFKNMIAGYFFGKTAV